MNQYKNKAQVLCLGAIASQDSEGEVLLKILPSCMIIECFIDHSEVPKFKKLGNRADIETTFKLVWFDIEKTDTEHRKFVQINRGTGVNRSVLTGQVINITDKNAIIDCGFIIIINTEFSNLDIKKDNWIKAEGRLDAYLMSVDSKSGKLAKK